ncbi:MAG: hypothetical protein ACRDRN_18320 [Sciscionella sp.]
MAQASETANSAADAARGGLRVLKRKAGKAGQVAEETLSARGLAPEQLADAVAGPASTARAEVAETTRRASKKLAKHAKRAGKELARSSKQAREDARQAAKDARRSGRKAAAKIAEDIDKKATKAQKKARKAAKGSRRRWPLLLGVGAVAIGVTYVVRSRAAAAQAEQDQPLGTGPHSPIGTPATNGSGQHARDESAKKN